MNIDVLDLPVTTNPGVIWKEFWAKGVDLPHQQPITRWRHGLKNSLAKRCSIFNELAAPPPTRRKEMSKHLIVGQSQQNDLAKVMAEAISLSLKPLIRRFDAIELQVRANSNAVENIERDGLVQKIVKSGLLNLDHARGLQIQALRELAKAAHSHSSAALTGGTLMNTNSAEHGSAGSFLDNIKAAGGDQ